MEWVFLFFGVLGFYGMYIAKRDTECKIAAHISWRMKNVSASLSAAQALDDLRMAVESGEYEATP